MALLDNLGTPAVVPLRAFDDYGAARKAIFDNVIASFGKKYPLTNQRYSLGVENLKYDSDKPFTIADQKRAILAGSNLERRLVGDWVLKDLTGKELDRKKATTVAHVPYMTDRGTFIHGGSEYSICLHPETMIWTEQGQIKIRDIVNKDMNVKVWSYDFASREFVLKPIVRKFKNKVIGGIGHIEFNSAGVYYAGDRKTHPPTTLWGTPTHRVYCNDGTKQELRYASKAAMVVKKLSYTQEQTLYGGLLGDSHIDPTGTLRLVHGIDQEEYFFFKKRIFGVLGETANGIYDNSRYRVSKKGVSTASHSAMIKTAFKANIEFCKARQLCYPNGKKTITIDWLDRIDEIGLAVWFMDDGSSFRQYPANTAGVVLCTQGFTEPECDIAVDWFMRRWSLKCFKSRNHLAYAGRNIGWTLNFCADEAERFFDIVAPYVHPSLFYKLLKRPITWSCFGCGCEVAPSTKWCLNCLVKNTATLGKKFLSERSARNLFGGLAAVRCVYRSGEKFTIKTGCERWEARMQLAGSRVSDMLADNKLSLSLSDIPCVYKEKTGKQWEKAATVYNLEVADTHNYFANSVLTSNCNQARLRPGIYSRHRESGELESHFNIKPGTGRSFRIYMEPATGIFRMGVGQSTLKLYPLLRAMGLQDRDIAPHWGKEILQANIEADDPRAVARAYAQFLDTRTSKEDAVSTKEAAGDNQGLALRKVFETSELDEDVTASTMGQAFKNAGPDAILGATSRLLKLSKGEGDTDDRDSLEYQTFHTPEDFFGERIEKDAGQVGRKLLWKATLHGNLSKIPPAALSRQVRSVILNAGLAQALEESNMLEPYDQAHRVIRLGEGGISSVDAIPDESRNVNPSQFGIIDAIRTPESSKAGIDTRLVKGTYKGPNNTVLFKVNNVRTGQPEFISAQQAAKLNIAFPGELADGAKRVRVMSKSRNINYVGRDEVDYELPSALNMFAAASNLTPMIGGIKGGRLSMGSRFANQALPLKDAEAPLVRSDADDLGIKAGAVKAGIAGIVTSVGKDHVEIRGIDGQKHRHELYNNFPLNRKTFIHNEALVKAGDQVSPSTVVAKSNYTDKNGDMAIGKNLKVAYLPWKGLAYEDAIVISESAAKKLSSEHMYQNVFEPEANDRADRRAFLSVFPTKYNDAQLRALDNSGVVKPGTVVKYGDPLLLATRKASHDAVHRGKEALFTDASMTWKHDSEGVVTDVSETKDGGWNITVKSYAPMQEADKLAGRFGDKGVISKILPDSQMPHSADGEAVDVILNPLGILSRGNPSQIYETLLGKVARKTGQPYKVPHFSKTALTDFVKAELQKHGVSDADDFINPDNGSKIPKVLNGERFFYKLHHVVESKGKARDVASYTIDDIPAGGGPEGSKRIAAMELGSLLSHGVPAVIRDAKTVRGQRNDEYWRYFRSGLTPPPPKVPMIYKKFIASLQSAGVNVQKKGDKLHLFSMTGAQMDALSGANEITAPETVQGDDLEPIEGGLFDPKLTGGHGGNKWSFVRLAEPMPNPVMEDPIRRLLGLTKKKYEALISGAEELQGERGGAGIKNLLSRINVPAKIQALEDTIKNGAKSKRDDAVKALGFLKSMHAEGVSPVDFITDKVPVLPPAFRPIVKLDKMLLNADPNFLYKDLMHVNSVLGKLGSQLSGAGSAEERLRVYNAYKAVTGLGDPVNAKTQEKNVKGVLGHIFGSSPKAGTFQRRVTGMPVDVVGRSVVTPSPDLSMDQIGVPEDLAWTVYRPFAVRRMIRAGMPATEAARAVADRKDVARRALIEEMGSRPVMMNRAPTLHKFNFMAFKPIMVAGKTIQVSPVVTKGFGMDFDGDQANFHVPVSDDAVQEALTKMLPSRNLFSGRDFKVHYTPSQEFLYGAWLAYRKSNKPARLFATREDALRAYKKGELRVDDPIQIGK